jgi:hypothetical protein
VLYLEQVAAGWAAVDDLEQGELFRAAVDALEPRIVTHDPPSFRQAMAKIK